MRYFIPICRAQCSIRIESSCTLPASIRTPGQLRYVYGHSVVALIFWPPDRRLSRRTLKNGVEPFFPLPQPTPGLASLAHPPGIY